MTRATVYVPQLSWHLGYFLAALVPAAGVDTYVETTTTPRIINDLQNFLGQPIDDIIESQAAYEMSSLNNVDEFRNWAYTLVIGEEDDSKISNRSNEINMIYVALADGTFIGYYDSTRYTFRAPGIASPAHDDFDISTHQPPFHLRDVNSVCACANPSWDPTRTMQASCLDGQDRVPDSNGACTRTCCDRDIRTYYATSRSLRGVPQRLTKWSVYDPRQRPWYIQQENRMRDRHMSLGWSSVYEFSSGGLGITATGSMGMSAGNGVFGIDYGLDDIQHLLTQDTRSFASAGGTWAFIVEASNGFVVGSTSGEALTA